MARTELAEITNLCMITDEKDRILVQECDKSEGWRGICFPGGHVEPGESFTRAVIREMREETGLTIESPKLCGIKQFQTEVGARYIVLFYKTDRFSGEIRDSEEGRVFWIRRDEIGNYRTVVDFDSMLRVFESDELSEFYYSRESGGEWKLELL